MSYSLYEIVREPIQIESLIKKIEHNGAGAITTFIGVVREWTKGKRTIYLEYQAYIPMAVKKISEIGNEIDSKWPDAKVAITHRIGHLNISEIAVAIVVSAPHRKVAYEANEYAIERIKEIVPIWKKEHWDNGEKWIGDQLEHFSYPDGKPKLEDDHDD